MFDRLLPRHVDNTYRGHALALWLFAVLVALKLTIGLNCILNGREVASSADGIPLDTFDPACARMIVSDFALWGLAQVMICGLCILVLVRYRALVPCMFTLLLLEHLGRKLILQVLPIVTTGKPPGFFVNLVLLALMVVGLALSLWSRDNPQDHVARRA